MKIRRHTYDDLLTLRGHRVRPMELEPGTTIAEACDDLKLKSAQILRNGEVADITTPLEDGDEIRICEGFDDPGTIVALVLAVVSAAASALLTRSLGALPGTDSEANEERRFGFNRFSNDARAGDPIPVVYGRRRRYGGKVIARIPVEDSRGSGNARLKILIALGHGEIAAIGDQTADFDDLASTAVSGIFLNDQPIQNFDGVRVSGRMGSSSQAAIRGFDDVEFLRDVGVGGIELTNTYGYEPSDVEVADAETIITSQDVDAVKIRLRFPTGLFNISSRSQLEPRTVKYRVRYRVDGAPSYGAWATYTVTQDRQSEFTLARLIEFGAKDTYDIQAQRVSVEPPANDPTQQDRFLWDSIIEIIDADETYDGIALLALDIPASDQIQTIPRISADITGRKVRTYTGGGPSAPTFSVAWSDNPAEIALDLLTDAAFGLGAMYGDAEVDFDSWIDWRDYCATQVQHPSGRTTNRFAINAVLDHHREGVEWLRVIARAGRATPVTVGGVWRWVSQAPQSHPVEVFTDGSIAIGDDGMAMISYGRELSTGAVRRPNRLALQFENAEQDDQPDVVAYPEFGQQWLATEQARENDGRLDGITDPDQAMAEAVYRMRSIRFRTRTISFVPTRPVVIVQPGERFDVATSLPGYGVASGRLRASSTAQSPVIDRDVTLEPGSTYTLQVIHLDGSIETRTILSTATIPAGSPLQLQGALATAPVEGTEYAILVDQIALKPYICTRVEMEDPDELRWRVEGLEYVEGVFDPDPSAIVDVPSYTTLRNPSTPPGPVLDLRVRERLVPQAVVDPVTGEITDQFINQIQLSWSQTVEDAQITASFRVYRRVVGTTSWVLLPEPKISGRSAVVEITDLNKSYQFTVVAVSVWGAALSPFDPRVPIASLAINSQDPALPPPDNPTLTRDTMTGAYTLSWDPVVGAVEYQVLAGRHTDSQVNSGAFDCYVIGRTSETEWPDLYLPAGVACTFRIRSVGENGRLSLTVATVSEASPTVLPSRSVVDTQDFDLSSVGTLTNLTHNASPTFNGQSQAARLELTSPGSAGQYEAPEVDLTIPLDTALQIRIGTAQDSDDPAINTDPLTQVPGTEADQWGIVQTDRTIGMIMPPWPDDELAYTIEYRIDAGVGYGPWTEIAPFGLVEAVLQKYQIRITLSRTTAPYRPGLEALEAVASR